MVMGHLPKGMVDILRVVDMEPLRAGMAALWRQAMVAATLRRGARWPLVVAVPCLLVVAVDVVAVPWPLGVAVAPWPLVAVGVVVAPWPLGMVGVAVAPWLPVVVVMELPPRGMVDTLHKADIPHRAGTVAVTAPLHRVMAVVVVVATGVAPPREVAVVVPQPAVAVAAGNVVDVVVVARIAATRKRSMISYNTEVVVH